MLGVEGESEYDGGGVMPNTVYPKGTDALTASDKLRLQSLTGQETDSRAAVDPFFWQGNERPDLESERQDYLRRQQERRRITQQERARYRETPY